MGIWDEVAYRRIWLPKAFLVPGAVYGNIDSEVRIAHLKPMTDLYSPLTFARGPSLKNRFMLAPLTNLQSHVDGVLSDDEFKWLTMRAKGGFGLTMTCAASIDAGGLGFPGQLGAHDDKHLEGLKRLADAIHAAGSVSSVQLHHAGMRTPTDLIGGSAPVCPSENEETGARALTLDEVRQLRDGFIAGAVRSEQAGFHGVEVHGAHGYLICQFLSPQINQRTDEYGGSLENRARFLWEIIDGIRAATGPDFTVGVRLSPERFGLKLMEIREVAADILKSGKVDYLDMSLWDCFKDPVEEEGKGRDLLGWFTDLERGDTRLGAAGKLYSAEDCRKVMAAGLDFVMVGRAAILHHDYPELARTNPNFVPVALPAPEAHLVKEGLGPAFIDYMKGWKGFVAE